MVARCAQCDFQYRYGGRCFDRVVATGPVQWISRNVSKEKEVVGRKREEGIRRLEKLEVRRARWTLYILLQVDNPPLAGYVNPANNLIGALSLFLVPELALAVMLRIYAFVPGNASLCKGYARVMLSPSCH